MSGVVFDNPSGWLWLTLVVLSGLAASWSVWNARAAQRRFVGAATTAIVPPGTLVRRAAKAVLCTCALVGLVLAWMGPRWGTYLERVQQRPIDLVVCLDVSRSMKAEDVGMSRLARAKDDTRRLLNRLDGASVGLVAFAGRGAILCPLTDDYDYVRMVLDDVDAHSAQAGGTDIGRAIAAAIKLFDDAPDRQRAVFLLSDGEDHNASAVAFAQQAAERGIRVFAFGYGDAMTGSRIPVDTPEGRGYLLHDGEAVLSRMNPDALSAVASAGGGGFVESTWGGNDRAIERTYDREFATIDGKPIRDSRTPRRHARYQWPAAFALLFLTFETILSERRRERRQGAASLPLRRAACIGGLALLPFVADEAKAQWLREPAAALVEEGNDRLARAEIDAALAAYTRANTRSPGTPEIAFNKAVAFYRRGDCATAAAVTQDALTTRDRRLEARATYNLARSLHEAAILGEKNTESAMLKLARAIGFYEDVLRLAPEDEAAAKNLDMAKRLMRFFEARLADERERPPPRKGTQSQEGQPNDDARQRSQEQQPDQQQARQQSSQDAEPQSAESRQSAGRQGDSGKRGEDLQDEGQQSARRSDEVGDTEAAMIPLEEAEAMLQDARDSELRRRAVLRERAIREQARTKPEKDW